MNRELIVGGLSSLFIVLHAENGVPHCLFNFLSCTVRYKNNMPFLFYKGDVKRDHNKIVRPLLNNIVPPLINKIVRHIISFSLSIFGAQYNET